MIHPDYFGYMAGFFTTIAFLPQVLRVWRTRSVEDISLGMYLLFITGVLCWLTYGILLASWPLILPNIVTFALAGTVLVYKIRAVIKKRKP